MELKKSNPGGVFVIVTSPIVVELRHAIIQEFFADIPIDPFIQQRIELIMSETVMDFIERQSQAQIVTHPIELAVLELLNYLQQHVMVLKIKEIYFLYHDSVFIHC